MKIRTDYSTQMQEQQRVRSTEETRKFGEMLAQEVQKSSSEQSENVASLTKGAGVLGAGSLAAVEGASPLESLSETEQKVMENIDGVLSKWENYAQSLSTPLAEESLKQAYDMLESIQTDVERIKAATPDLGNQNPSLKSMVDELEIMTVTEQFKFNRGDYL